MAAYARGLEEKDPDVDEDEDEEDRDEDEEENGEEENGKKKGRKSRQDARPKRKEWEEEGDPGHDDDCSKVPYEYEHQPTGS